MKPQIVLINFILLQCYLELGSASKISTSKLIESGYLDENFAISIISNATEKSRDRQYRSVFQQAMLDDESVIVEKFEQSGKFDRIKKRAPVFNSAKVETILIDAKLNKTYRDFTVNLTRQYLFVYSYSEIENLVS